MSERFFGSGLIVEEKFVTAKKPFAETMLNEALEKASRDFSEHIGGFDLFKSIPEFQKAVSLTPTDVVYVIKGPPRTDVLSKSLEPVTDFEFEKGIKFPEFSSGPPKPGARFTDPAGRTYVFRKDGKSKGRWRRADSEEQEKQDRWKLGEQSEVGTEKRVAGRDWYVDENGHATRQMAPTQRFKTRVKDDSIEVQETVARLLPFEVLFGEHPDVEAALIAEGEIDPSEMEALHVIREQILSTFSEGFDEDNQFDPDDPSTVLDWLLTQTDDPDKYGVDIFFDKLHAAIKESYDEEDAAAFNLYFDQVYDGWRDLVTRYTEALEKSEVLNRVKQSLYNRFDEQQREQYFQRFEPVLSDTGFADRLLDEDPDHKLSQEEKGLLLACAFFGDYSAGDEDRSYSVWNMGTKANVGGRGTERSDVIGQIVAMSGGFTDIFSMNPDDAFSVQGYFNQTFAGALYAIMAHYDAISHDAQDALGDDNDADIQDALSHVVDMYLKEHGKEDASPEARGIITEKILNAIKSNVASAKQIADAFNANTGWHSLNDFFDERSKTKPTDALKDIKALEKISDDQREHEAFKGKALDAKQNGELLEHSIALKEGAFNKDGKLNIYNYQKKFINWMTTAKRGIIGADTGLGKTPMSIAFVDHLIATGKGKRGIFVMPPALMKQWPGEIEKFRPGSKVVVLDSELMDKEDRVLLLEQINAGKLDADFVICSAGMLSDDEASHTQPMADGSYASVFNGEKSRFLTAFRDLEGAMFVDEYHTGGFKTGDSSEKGAASVRNQALNFVANSPENKREHFFGLTATPIPNSPRDLYTLLDTAHPGCMGANADKFTSGFGSMNFDKDKGEWEISNQADLVKLKEAINPYLFVMRKTDPEYVEEMKARNQLPLLQSNEKYSDGVQATPHQMAIMQLLQDDLFDMGWPEIKAILGVPQDVQVAQTQVMEGKQPVFETDENGDPKLDDGGSPIPKMRELYSPKQIFEKAMMEEDGVTSLTHMKAKGAAITISRKLALHPGMLFEDPTVYKGKSPKIDGAIDAITDHLSNPDHYHAATGTFKPIVVFADYGSAFKVLKNSLKEKLGLTDDEVNNMVGTIASGVGKDERASIQDAVNEGKMPIVCVGIRAGGAGLNLQKSANHIIFLDKPWSPDAYEQCYGRVQRPGYQQPENPIEGFHKPDEAITVSRMNLAGFEQQRGLDAVEDAQEALDRYGLRITEKVGYDPMEKLDSVVAGEHGDAPKRAMLRDINKIVFKQAEKSLTQMSTDEWGRNPQTTTLTDANGFQHYVTYLGTDKDTGKPTLGHVIVKPGGKKSEQVRHRFSGHMVGAYPEEDIEEIRQFPASGEPGSLNEARKAALASVAEFPGMPKDPDSMSDKELDDTYRPESEQFKAAFDKHKEKIFGAVRAKYGSHSGATKLSEEDRAQRRKDVAEESKALVVPGAKAKKYKKAITNALNGVSIPAYGIEVMSAYSKGEGSNVGKIVIEQTKGDTDPSEIIPITDASIDVHNSVGAAFAEAAKDSKTHPGRNINGERAGQMAFRKLRSKTPRGNLPDGTPHYGFLTYIKTEGGGKKEDYHTDFDSVLTAISKSPNGPGHEDWEDNPFYDEIELTDNEIALERPDWTRSIDEHMTENVGGKALLASAILNADTSGDLQATVAADQMKLFGKAGGARELNKQEGLDIYAGGLGEGMGYNPALDPDRNYSEGTKGLKRVQSLQDRARELLKTQSNAFDFEAYDAGQRAQRAEASLNNTLRIKETLNEAKRQKHEEEGTFEGPQAKAYEKEKAKIEALRNRHKDTQTAHDRSRKEKVKRDKAIVNPEKIKEPAAATPEPVEELAPPKEPKVDAATIDLVEQIKEAKAKEPAKPKKKGKAPYEAPPAKEEAPTPKQERKEAKETKAARIERHQDKVESIFTGDSGSREHSAVTHSPKGEKAFSRFHKASSEKKFELSSKWLGETVDPNDRDSYLEHGALHWAIGAALEGALNSTEDLQTEIADYVEKQVAGTPEDFVGVTQDDIDVYVDQLSHSIGWTLIENGFTDLED